MDLFSKLNENQEAAVRHTDGPLLILAGAGSGKTRVITHRIAYLIREQGVAPYRIFAVTFTNKAAEEMRKRIVELIGSDGSSVFIKTFHSAAVYILRRYGEAIGIPNGFSIYDGADQASVVKSILKEMKLDPKKIRPQAIVSKISEVKDKEALIEGADISSLLPDTFAYNFPEIYTKYHEKLKSQNALDFNDLLIKTVELFRNAPDVLQSLQNQWRYYMIDEYQDTNHAQYLIAKYLAKERRNICVVGDDDQSIYSWRGADIRNILDFEKDYTEAKVITLEENYRSTEPILQSASAVIKNNLDRKEKEVKAVRGDGEPITYCVTNNEYGEAEYVVNTLTSLKIRENLKNKDFSIFYRTNAQSRVFEEHLRKEKIPYRVIGGLKFYDRKEIKDIIAYLRLIVNPRDSVSLLRIINTPARGIGAATIEKINDIAVRNDLTLWRVIDEELMAGRVPKGLGDFKKIIRTAMNLNASVPEKMKLSDLVNDVINLSGYRKTLEEENTIESGTRLENIDELVNSVYDHEVASPDTTLDEFLQDISLLTSEDTSDDALDVEDRNNAVTLMTVHNAKGLEFPVVFLTGMEEDVFPHKFSQDSEEGIEEERRLCYVGITRAMDRIFITNAELRRSYYGVEYRQPSRFIEEIPPQLRETKSFNSSGPRGVSGGYSGGSSSYRSTGRGTSSSSSSSFKKKPVEPSSASSGLRKERPEVSGETSPNNTSEFKLRERVLHPRYGAGLITKIEGSGDNLKLTIIFNSGKKTFLEKYTPLEKL